MNNDLFTTLQTSALTSKIHHSLLYHQLSHTGNPFSVFLFVCYIIKKKKIIGISSFQSLGKKISLIIITIKKVQPDIFINLAFLQLFLFFWNTKGVAIFYFLLSRMNCIIVGFIFFYCWYIVPVESCHRI